MAYPDMEHKCGICKALLGLLAFVSLALAVYFLLNMTHIVANVAANLTPQIRGK